MDFEKERISELIKELKKGNKEVFEEFYKLTSPRAYFVALKILRNEHDAEDILQESYIKLLENIDDIDTDKNFMAWFYRIVANKSKDFLKKQKLLVFEGDEEEIFESIPDENPQFSPEENLNQDELCNEVMAAIDELTAEKRACIMMRYFGEMSVNEIAESLEVPVSTVKNRLFTARKDLKNRFEKNGSTVLYSAAPIGVVAWALGKTSQTVSAAFAASAASAEILAGVGAAGGITVAAASTTAAATTTAAVTTTATTTAAATTTVAATTTAATAASTAASTAAATGAGVAAKVAALSVAQKVVIGAVAAGVVGGSTAGVATVVKDNAPPPTTTQYIVEEVTTAPSQLTEFAFAVYETKTETTDKTTQEKTRRRHTTTQRREKTTEEKTATDKPKETKENKTKASTTRRHHRETTLAVTTRAVTTTVVSTTLTTTQPTTEETTAEPTTTRAVTTTKAPTTAKPATTKPATTAQPTTQSPATLIIEVTDFDNNVVDTITVNVDAGTQLSREYLVAIVSANGYEAMAGVYGDAIGSAAQDGQTYTFTAEL